jgi:tRNA-modifying protein YgfZ
LKPGNIIDLNQHYGIVKILGNDPAKFLQGQLTCDVTEVTEQNSVYGCYCNIKGRVELTFWVFKLGSNFYLRLPKILIKYAIKELSKYAIFSKIVVTESTLPFNHYGIIGSLSSFAGNGISFDYSKLGIKNLYEIFTNDDLKPTGNIQDWQQQLIKHKIPEIYPETIGCFLPHNIGLCKLNAISFTKGCYRGQEIVARMEYLGNIKYQLQTITIQSNNNIKLGDDIYDENKKSIGKIVNYCDNFALIQQPLCCIHS